jgi:hypothetical protein
MPDNFNASALGKVVFGALSKKVSAFMLGFTKLQ